MQSARTSIFLRADAIFFYGRMLSAPTGWGELNSPLIVGADAIRPNPYGRIEFAPTIHKPFQFFLPL
jgi:hypothetical protein